MTSPLALDSSIPPLGIYQSFLPAPALRYLFSDRFLNGIYPYATKCATEYGITPDQALEEFRRFIALKMFVSDHHALKLGPTTLMNAMWHQVILDTEFYADMQKGIETVLHHRSYIPSPKEQQKRQQKLDIMNALYTQFFHHKAIEVDDKLCGEIHAKKARMIKRMRLDIVNMNEKDDKFSILIYKTATVSALKMAIAENKGFPEISQTLRYRGQKLIDPEVLKTYEIPTGSVIELTLENYKPKKRSSQELSVYCDLSKATTSPALAKAAVQQD